MGDALFGNVARPPPTTLDADSAGTPYGEDLISNFFHPHSHLATYVNQDQLTVPRWMCAGRVVSIVAKAGSWSMVNSYQRSLLMNRRVVAVLGAASLLVVLGTVPARAMDKARIDVKFAFSAGDVDFTAGIYDFSVEKEGQLTIQDTASGKRSVVGCFSRLSARDNNKPLLVFDKAEDKSYLTEIYFPGVDGYFLKGAPGKHAHAVAEGTEESQ
jgi:hypothetical protein